MENEKRYPTPRGPAANQAKNKYNAANYERQAVFFKIGQNQVIRDHAAARGESINGFINRAIFEQIKRDNNN